MDFRTCNSTTCSHKLTRKVGTVWVWRCLEPSVSITPARAILETSPPQIIRAQHSAAATSQPQARLSCMRTRTRRVSVWASVQKVCAQPTLPKPSAPQPKPTELAPSPAWLPPPFTTFNHLTARWRQTGWRGQRYASFRLCSIACCTLFI